MQEFLGDAVLALGWALVGALSMGIALGILLKVFTWLTPIQEWEEIKKGNVSVGIILAAAILAMAIVVAVAISPGA